MSSASHINTNINTNSSDPPAPQSTTLPPTHPFDPTSHTTPFPAPAPSTPTVKPARTPLLRLELRDVSSTGAHAFLRLVHASDALSRTVDTVLQHLYRGMPQSEIPGTRSVTLVLRDMEGVAYTTGLELDDEHKEIHFNTLYISSVAPARQKEEIMGVLVHEMVHCWQRDGLGTAPTGLTEGVADWVRLKAGYAPPHWKRRLDCEWDAGYERTGYFLEWLEKEHGEDVVRRINGALRACKYEEERVWKECCGKGVQELWKEYRKCFEDESK